MVIAVAEAAMIHKHLLKLFQCLLSHPHLLLLRRCFKVLSATSMAVLVSSPRQQRMKLRALLMLSMLTRSNQPLPPPPSCPAAPTSTGERVWVVVVRVVVVEEGVYCLDLQTVPSESCDPHLQ